MIRKITCLVTLTLLLATAVFAQSRGRTIGRESPHVAALLPLAAPGTTVSGIVTSVSGNVLSLAGGLVTIDASQARISNERGETASIGSIITGSMVVAILSSSNVSANAPLPAMIIGVSRIPQVSLVGPVQSVTSNSLTVLGRTIAVDANTSYGGRSRTVADIVPGDVVQVHANNVNGVLVASSVLSAPPLPRPSIVIHGTVKSIAPDSWVITDRSGKDWTVLLNAQTKIAGDPRVGDQVEILVNTDTANQYVAVSIVKSVRPEFATFMGSVKSIGPASWVIRDARSNVEITVAVNSQTKIVGNPIVNDGVHVISTVDTAGRYTAVSITRLGIVPAPEVTITGVVKSIGGLPEVWEISQRDGKTISVHVNSRTRITGNPRIGDNVEIVASYVPNQYTAISITKK